MKKLTKIKLINWHYFFNETINIKNDCLITGQNATGKSTILDALQYVLTAGDQNFNMAAHDHGNRNLRGYICCKLGLDNQEYLRSGDVSTHLALEFFDDTTNEYFVVGVAMDYKNDVDTIKTIFYSTPRALTDEMYIENKMVLSIPQFKKTGLIQDFYQTKRETKVAYRNLFGPINERFFTLIQKALAFKPINNVKDFIYLYLLEEKKIDVENIQDSIRMYKDLERTLKVIKRKISDLSEIQGIAANISRHNDKSTVYNLLIKLTSIDEQKIRVEKYKNDLVKVLNQKDDQELVIRNIESNISVFDEKSKVLYSSLASNDSFKNKEQLQAQIARVKNELFLTSNKRDKLFEHMTNNHLAVDNYAKKGDIKPYKALRNFDLKLITADNFNDYKGKLITINSELDIHINNLYQLQGQLLSTKKEKTKEYEEIVNTIKTLEGRKFKYNPNVITLRDTINERLAKSTGTDAKITVLAELLEITDPEWSDAIENYLNTQRFTLIVDPAYYDFALDVFDEIKSKKPIYGVGIVNTKKLGEYEHAEVGSLADIISSHNIHAKRYINMLLGNVKRAKDVHDLENYRTAITKDSVVYNNYTVRQLNLNIEKPYIGRNAISKQLPKFEQIERKLHQEYTEIEKKLRNSDDELQLIKQLNVKGFIDSLNVLLAYDTQNKTFKELESQSSQKVTMSLSDLQKEYEKINAQLFDFNRKRVLAYEELGRVKEKITTIEKNIEEFEVNVINNQKSFDLIKNDYLQLQNEVFNTYLTDSKKLRSSELLIRYQKEAEGIISAKVKLEDELKSNQLHYNNEFNFLGMLGYDNMTYYLKEYDKLVSSNLVEYEDKVRIAREDTERIFKEDFIAKLRSNILAAQDGVKKINQALKEIKFGDDRYEFVFPKSKEFSSIYDMVMNEEEVKGPIVTSEFEIKYKAELAMLFESLSVEEINSEGVISKFTDYRTYMDYDIRITNNSGDVAFFSKIFKEKSGGETQVPFYVSIVASFVQLYSGVKSSIGLIIFDEAFDKMDSSRIEKMMEFVRGLDLQLIIAATPQKLYPITNYVDTTLIVVRRNRQSYVVPKTNK